MAGTRKKGRLYDHGRQLRELRELAGLTLAEAAKVTGISWQTLGDVENDKLGIKLDDVSKLLELYKVKNHSKEVKEQRNDLTDAEREGLFRDNQRLAYYFVNRYYDPGNAWADKREMEQIAMTALWQAVCYHDPNNEYKFSAYASRLIKGELVDYLYTERQARKGVTASKTTMFRAVKARQLKNEGVVEEKISAELGLGVDAVRRLIELTEMPFAEPLTVSDDDGNEMERAQAVETYDDYDNFYNEGRVEALREAVSSLPRKQRDIIARVYGLDGSEPMTVRNYAKQIGKSYGAVSRHYYLGMARLRHPRLSAKLAELI